VEFLATRGTAGFLNSHGIATTSLAWPLEAGEPNARDVIRERRVDLVINIPKHDGVEELANDYVIRRTAVDFGVPLITNLQLAQRLSEALARVPLDRLEIRPWSSYRR